jgi:tetratricopeptide (TPR) repeat protein
MRPLLLPLARLLAPLLACLRLLAATAHAAGPVPTKTYEALVTTARFADENNRLLEAIDAYRQALELASPLDARLQQLERQGVKPSPELPLACFAGAATGQAEIGAAAQKLEAAEPGQALRCLRQTLSGLSELRARRADLLYMAGNPDLALLEHRRVLEREKDFPESLFFIGAILLEKGSDDPAKVAEGKRLWSRLLEVAPKHPRAATVRDSLPRLTDLFGGKGAPLGRTGAR